MSEKMAKYFHNPVWIQALSGKTKEKLAEDLGVTEQTIFYWINHANNPAKEKQKLIERNYGIKFESIGIKDLILRITHASNSVVSQNGKRVFMLLILYEGKMPGASISIDDLMQYGKAHYGYNRRGKVIEGIKNLEASGLVDYKDDFVSLSFSGCKRILQGFNK